MINSISIQNEFAMHFLLRKSLIALLLLWMPLSNADELTIAVAANFTRAAKQLVAEFEQRSEHRVHLAFGSTGGHYAQIIHGAPFDAFFAADAKTPMRLEEEGKIRRGSRFTYTRGLLVLWSPKAGVVDPEGKVLQRGDFAHLAMANPRLAPYGLAAQQTLEALGVAEKLQEKLVRGENISQTHQFIHSGAAELGFVALAQIIDPGQPEQISGSYWRVPVNYYKPIEQQAVLLSDKKAAREFIAFVRSEKGKAIIRGYGYE